MEKKNLSSALRGNQVAIQEIAQDAGVNLKDCYQCGKCSAGCPVASEADMPPRAVIRNLQLGCLDPVLSSTMPWLCVGCGMCLARCPQSVDMPTLNAALRRYIKAHDISPALSNPDRFNRIFAENVRQSGVSDEVKLAVKFNMRSGKFMQDANTMPAMVMRGMINNNGHKLEDPADVERIFARVEAELEQKGTQGGDSR